MHLASNTGAAQVRDRRYQDKMDDAEHASKTAHLKQRERKHADGQHHRDEAERERQQEATQKSESKVQC
jgi:hypothetical protein